MDTGVTKSDLELWQKYVQNHVKHRLAVLNKVDSLWDDLKPSEHIQASITKRLQQTAKQLELPDNRVLAISARQALIAKIKGDELLLKKSGIEKLETILAREIIPARRVILRDSVVHEVGKMVDISSQSAHRELAATQNELKELGSLTGKNRDIITNLMDKLHADKQVYQETVKSFEMTRSVTAQQGIVLLSNLGQETFDRIISQSKDAIQDSWTTAGLNRGMRSLVPQAIHQFDKIQKHSVQIKKLMDTIYERLHEKHGFKQQMAPPLDLQQYRNGLNELTKRADEFCRDPINVMTEKHFLVKKFYLTLVSEASRLFERARTESQSWLRNSMAPLTLQINEHGGQLERRLENIRKIHENIDSLESRVREFLKIQDIQSKRVAMIDGITNKLQGDSAPVEALAQA
jgi:hypothetical protein